MISREQLWSLKIRSLFFIRSMSCNLSSSLPSSPILLAQYGADSNKLNAFTETDDEKRVEAFLRALVQFVIQSSGLWEETINTWQKKCINIICSRIFENVTTKWAFCVQPLFFPPKTISKAAVIKTKSATIVFSLLLLFPPASFFFSFPFPSLVWFWSLSGPRNLPFDAFPMTQITANFLRLVFKKIG